MINADFARCEDRLSLEIKGHADYAKDGSDIVCAAVSGIFYALLGYVKNECVSLNIKRLSSGDSLIECSLDAEAAMKLAYIGFLQIGISYPGTVNVSERLWNSRCRETREACAL